LSNSCAMLVRAPVAISHGLPFGALRSAEAMASMAGSDLAGSAGGGRREVPSNPDSPWMSPAWTAGRTSPEAAPG
jgi:hypothetical protein